VNTYLFPVGDGGFHLSLRLVDAGLRSVQSSFADFGVLARGGQLLLGGLQFARRDPRGRRVGIELQA